VTEAYDAVVLGSGFAGGVAALRLASRGVRVAWVDRAGDAEAVPRFDGVLSERALGAALDESDRAELPRERRTVERRLAFLGPEGFVSFEFRSAQREGEADRDRVTIRRDRVDPWLAERARAAGARVLSDRTAEDVIRGNGGGVLGVQLGTEELRALVTIVARDGELSLAGLGAPSGPTGPAYPMAADLYRMDAASVENRFALGPDEGVTVGFVLGFLPETTAGQGYLLVHRDALTLGVTLFGETGPDARARAEETLEALVRHPAIEPRLRGAVRERRSAFVRRLHPPGALAPLSGPGLLTVGSAAGLWAPGPVGPVELGFAARSARLAADVAAEAVRASDAGAGRMREYDDRLRSSGLLTAVATAQREGERLMAPGRFRTTYPRFLEEVFHRLMTEVEGPKRSISESVRGARRATGLGWSELARDVAETGRTL
jgi:electron transfer flavoprotein-quinone oxidoreductase